jgi:biopolymer transport protein ExbD
MRVTKPIALFLSGLAALVGRASANDTKQPTPLGLLPLKVQWTDGKCSISSEDRTFVLPDQQIALNDYLTGLSSSKDAISLSGDVRYECVTQVMSAAKRSGIKRLGFISEPPSPDAR